MVRRLWLALRLRSNTPLPAPRPRRAPGSRPAAGRTDPGQGGRPRLPGLLAASPSIVSSPSSPSPSPSSPSPSSSTPPCPPDPSSSFLLPMVQIGPSLISLRRRDAVLAGTRCAARGREACGVAAPSKCPVEKGKRGPTIQPPTWHAGFAGRVLSGVSKVPLTRQSAQHWRSCTSRRAAALFVVGFRVV